MTYDASDTNENDNTADGDVEFASVNTDSATVNGSLTATSGTITNSNKDIPGVPSTSGSGGLSFGTWKQASADRPAVIIINSKCVTDGSNNADIRLEVDESGGTSLDYQVFANLADASFGSGETRNTVTWELPAGAQYRLNNKNDPTGSNSIFEARELIK